MMLVRLIVTGNVEFEAFGTFLKRVFPAVEFESERVSSFTSSRLTHRSDNSKAVSLVEKIVTSMIAAIDLGRKKPNGQIPDLVVAVDDLELFNLDQPKAVIEAVRFAVEPCVLKAWSSIDRQAKCLARLKETASFHLLSPMLESYFFTDEDSLRAVGISSQPKLVHEKDIENFETCDEVYLLKYATLNDCEPNEPLRPNTKTWHARHPKDYLKHLIAVGEDGIYRETKGGVSALRALSPIRAMEVSSQRQFLRSLINDMANALNVPLSPDFVGDCHPVTSCHGKGDRILRNI